MAQTWILNETLPRKRVNTTWEFNFKSDEVAFNSIVFEIESDIMTIMYIKDNISIPVYNSSKTPAWSRQIYRTIVFTDIPSNIILSWLNNNATLIVNEYLTTNVDLLTVANAIRNKTGGTTEIVYPNGYVTEIKKLSNTSADTVTAVALVKGQTAHNNSGYKITGTMTELNDLTYDTSNITDSNNYFIFPSSIYGGDDYYYVKGENATTVNVGIGKGTFGDATAANVLKNKYFSSVEGISLIGTMPDATFANSASSGTTYTDVSSSAPVLVSDDYLYINKGYTDNVKISLAKLVPDGASDVSAIKNGMLQSISAYDNDGKLVAGNIASKTTEVFYPSTQTQTIDAGKYLSGDQIIFAVATSGLAAENIIKGATITVGDSDNASRIASITGTADYVKNVTAVPTTKDTNIVHNSTNGKYYVWKE